MLADHYGLTLKSRTIADLERGADRRAARRGAAVPDVAARALRRGDEDARRWPQPGHVTDALTFASRAWRRPLTAAEKTSLRAFYQKSRTRHRSRSRRRDARGDRAHPRLAGLPLSRRDRRQRRARSRSNGWEMASRLSFFLWSSIPDDELRRAAAAGELSDPAQVARQVKRMTADPKARRLATEFFGQWLGFYHFDQYRGVDTDPVPRVHRRDQVGDVRRSRLHLRIHRPAGTAGEGDPASPTTPS